MTQHPNMASSQMKETNKTDSSKETKKKLGVESLEAMVLMSASPADAAMELGMPTIVIGTSGDDNLQGTEANEIFDPLEGNDTVDAGGGNDSILFTTNARGIVDGGEGTDIADFFYVSSGVNVDLTSGTVSGGVEVQLANIETVIGTQHDDVFAFSQPQAGDDFVVEGVAGNNVIDLSTMNRSDVDIDGNTITGSVGSGEFRIEFGDIAKIRFADIEVDSDQPGENGSDGNDTGPETPAPGENTNPLAAGDVITTSADTPVSINVLQNDFDADGDAITVTGIINQPSNGVLTENAPGVYEYLPNSGFVGTDTFSYEVSDGNGGTGTAHVTIYVESSDPVPTPEEPSGTLEINGTIGDYEIERNQNGELIIRNTGTGETTDISVYESLQFGNETILLSDVLVGSDVGDVLNNADAKRIVSGGSGNDQIVTSNGNDRVLAGSGDDTVSVEVGSKTIDGGDGNDVVNFSDPVNDFDVEATSDGKIVVRNTNTGELTTLVNVEQINFQSQSIDVSLLLAGGSLDDQLSGGDGDDLVSGGGGDDILSGGGGNDEIFGGSGNDTIDTGVGDDYVNAGDGDDRVTAISGSNVVDGGAGNDTVRVSGNVNQFLLSRGVDGSIQLSNADNRGDVTSIFDVELIEFDDVTLTDSALELAMEAAEENLFATNVDTESVEVTAKNLETEQRVRVYAQRVDLQGNPVGEGDIAINRDGVRFGVVGAEEAGVSDQIGLDPNSMISEQLVFEFDGVFNQAEFSFTNLFQGEGDSRGAEGHEQGRWEAYLDGELVATNTFVATASSAYSGPYSVDAGVVTLQLPPGVTADTIAFSATRYSGGQNGVTSDSSDFNLTSVTVELMDVEQNGEIEISAGDPVNLDIQLADNVDLDRSTVTIFGVPDSAILTAGERNDDGTWTVSAGDIAEVALRTPTSFVGEIDIQVTVNAIVEDSPNQVVNGSFEDNNIRNRGWGVVDQVEGWTTAYGEGIEIQNNIAGDAADGNSKVELDSHDHGGEALGSNSAMHQDVETVPGQTYRLSVEYSPRPGVAEASNGVEVYFDGKLVDTLTGNGVGLGNTQWTTHVFNVEASSDSSRIEFRAIGTADSLGGYVDDVQLNEITRQTKDVSITVEPSDDADNLISENAFETSIDPSSKSAQVVETSGDVAIGTFGTDGMDFSRNQTENAVAMLFAEPGVTVLDEPLSVNKLITEDGDVVLRGRTNGVIPAGTAVESYFLHFDTELSEQVVNGSVTFDRPIDALIFGTGQLDASDHLGRDVDNFQNETTDGRGRAWGDRADQIRISNDGHTLEFVGDVHQVWTDNIRVLFVDDVADVEETNAGDVFTMSQEVLGLEEGKVYDITIEVSDPDGSGEPVAIYFGGEVVTEVRPEDLADGKVDVNVRAGSGDGSNTFEIRSGVYEDGLGISIDDVRMTKSDNLLVNGSFENLTGLSEARWGHYGDSIQGWVMPSQGELVSFENFEGGADGWSVNATSETSELSEFLGKFGGSNGEEMVSKTFQLSGDHDYAVVEFDFLKIDSWDSSTDHAGSNEAFNIFLNNGEVLAFEPEAAVTVGQQNGLDGITGTNGNVRYTITSSGVDEGMNGRNDHSIHWQERVYHVRLEVADPGDSLTLGFGSTLNQSVSDESFGIDNVVVIESDDSRVEPGDGGSVSSAGNRFEAHNPRGGVEATDGDYWMDMGGSPGNLSMSQHVPGVEFGESYVLSFDLADSSHDTTDGLNVVWNGEVIAEIDNQDNTMDRFEFEVIGGSGDGSNTLTFEGTGNANQFGVSLDNVELVEGSIDLVQFESDQIQLDASNLDTAGARMYAQRVDAVSGQFVEQAELVVQADGKIGVAGTEELGPVNQIGMNLEDQIAEQVVVEFDNDFAGGEFTFTNLFKGEGDNRDAAGDEQGKWEAFKDGEVVASGTFVASQGHAGTVEVELPEGVTADKLAITPTEYSGGQLGSMIDSSDFFITSVTAEVAESATVVVAGDASSLGIELSDNVDRESSTVTISNLPEGSVLSVGTDNGDGTWTLQASEAAEATLRTPNGFAGEVDVEVTVNAVTATTPNLVTNGSFEDNSIRDRGWGVVDQVEGWTTANGEGIEIQRNVAGSASDGESKVELDSHDHGGEALGSNSGMQQDIATEAGRTYQFSFDYSPRPNVAQASNVIEVYFNGEMIDTIAAEGKGLSNTQWERFSYSVVAEGDSSRIEFRAAGTEDSLGGYLDNVALQAATVDTAAISMSVEASADPENYVANGSFENVNGREIADGSWIAMNEIAGWQLEEGGQFEVMDDGHRGVEATDGDNTLDMDSYRQNMTVSQQVLGLEDGKVYEFSFDTITSPNYDGNSLDVYWNGEKVSEVGNESDSHSLTLRAGSGDGSNTIRFVGTAENADSRGLALDNVRMVDSDNLLVNGSFENTTGMEEKGWGISGGEMVGWTNNGIQQVDFTDGVSVHGGNAQDRGGSFEVQDNGDTLFLAENGWKSVLGDYNITENTVLEFEYKSTEKPEFVSIGFDTDATWHNDGANDFFKIFGDQKHGDVADNAYAVYEGDGEYQTIRIPVGQFMQGQFDRMTFVNDDDNLVAHNDANTGVEGNSFFRNVRFIEESGSNFEAHNPRGGVEATDGDYWMDMGGSPGNLSMSQHVPGVEFGESYVLSFDLADSSHDTTDGLNVVWNGEVIAEIDNQDNTMDRFEFEVIGGSGDGSNTLTFEGTGNANQFGVSLDNVELVEGSIDLVQFESDQIQLDASNLDTAGARMYAQRVDAVSGQFVEQAELVVQADGKIGVAGTEELGPVNQIGMNLEDQIAEQVVVEFDNDFAGGEFTFTNLFKGEGDNRDAAGDEQGKWEAFKDGEVVASGTFVASQGHAGTVEVELPEGVTADKLAITPTEYSGGQLGSMIDSSDFFITSVTADMAQAEIQIKSGSSASLGIELSDDVDVENSTLTLGNLPNGVTLSHGSQNPDGTWTVPATDAGSLEIQPPSDFSGQIDVKVQIDAASTYAPNLVANGSFETAVERIEVANGDFEDRDWNDGGWTWGGLPGWETVGADGQNRQGDWDPTTRHYAGLATGEQVGWANSYTPDEVAGIGQTVDATFDPEKDYTLTFDIGNRADGLDGEFEIRLIAGDTVIGSKTGMTADIANGTFQTFKVDVAGQAFAGADFVGEDLRIELLSTGNGGSGVGQVNFDNVRLMEMNNASTDRFSQNAAGTERGWGVFNEVEGWKSTGDGAGIEVQERVAGDASDGFAHVELDSHNNSGMYQDLKTSPGQEYQFSFDYSPRPGVAESSNTIEVYVDGQLIDTVSRDGKGLPGTDWERHTYTIEATGENTRVEFRAAGTSDSLGGYLDRFRSRHRLKVNLRSVFGLTSLSSLHHQFLSESGKQAGQLIGLVPG